jgi:hypothetical protein
MTIVPFKPEHISTLVLQDAQSWMGPMLKPEYGVALQKGGPCFTALDGDRVLGCAGVVKMWEGRDQAWALLARDCGGHFIGIYRGIRRFLELHDTRRIEATVDARFDAGHRLMRLLGFKREGTMLAYLADGRDCDLYSLVRG